jgi:hypothetical protein
MKQMRFFLNLGTLIGVFPAKRGEKHIYFGRNKLSSKLGCVNLTIRSFSSSKIKVSLVVFMITPAKNYAISPMKPMRFFLDLRTLIGVFPAKQGEKHINFGTNK